MKSSDLNRLAIERYHDGKIEDSAQLLVEAITQARNEGEVGTELMSRTNLCEAYTRLGECTKAVECATELLIRSKQEGLEQYQLRAIGSLAIALQQVNLRERWSELKSLLLEGLDIAHRLSVSYWQVMIFENLGNCATKMGEYEEAFTWLQEALNTLRIGEDEESFFRSRIYQSFSHLHRQRGNISEAIRYSEMAIGVAENNKEFSPHLVATSKLAYALAEDAHGEKSLALEIVEEILKQASREKWKLEQQSSLFLKAKICLDLNYLDLAEKSCRQALELARDIQMKEEEVRCLLLYGRVLFALSLKDKAKDSYQLARKLSEDRGYHGYFSTAEDLLNQI